MTQIFGPITGLAFAVLTVFLLIVGIEGCTTDMARF